MQTCSIVLCINVECCCRPDLIINPHAFPSRMTIGMLVESLVSKLGALSGEFVDATPFQKCEKPDTFVNPIEEFGTRLEQAGFAKHGGEPNMHFLIHQANISATCPAFCH